MSDCTYKDIEVETYSPNWWKIDECGELSEPASDFPNQIVEINMWHCGNCDEVFDETKLISNHVNIKEEEDE